MITVYNVLEFLLLANVIISDIENLLIQKSKIIIAFPEISFDNQNVIIFIKV